MSYIYGGQQPNQTSSGAWTNTDMIHGSAFRVNSTITITKVNFTRPNGAVPTVDFYVAIFRGSDRKTLGWARGRSGMVSLNVPVIIEANTDYYLVHWHAGEGASNAYWSGIPSSGTTASLDSGIILTYGTTYYARPSTSGFQFNQPTDTFPVAENTSFGCALGFEYEIGAMGTVWTFTNTSTGRNGSIQTWTVPKTGIYTIEAWGAQGGQTSGSSYRGGYGARMRGDFVLNKGEVLKILVGQMGLGATGSNTGSGGGGGTFVTKSNNSPLIVAGGGGGGARSDAYSHGTGGDAPTTNSGDRAGTQSGQYGNGRGAGFSQNGDNALSFTNGGTGGAEGWTDGGDGGFGGGAGNSGHLGGGGGGYSGGSGGYLGSSSGGPNGQKPEGGGSYNIGTNQGNTAGARSGHGLVIITAINKRTESWGFGYSGTIKSFTAPYTGLYKLQLWGAQGGNANGNANHRTPSGQNISQAQGGKGGYSEGFYYMTAGQTIYIGVGSQGGTSNMSYNGSVSGGYNGGGDSSGVTTYGGGGGGGGATHISTQNAILKSCSKSNVIMVAGGGGGAWGTSYSWSNYRGLSEGGVGGGLTGGRGGYSGSMGYTSTAGNSNIYNQADTRSQAYNYATGGTQSAGGTQGTASGSNSYRSQSVAPSFGLGGSSGDSGSHSGGGGGGGYYGGAGGASGENANGTGGGGGSSYIGGVTDGLTYSGDQVMPTYNNSSTMVGNAGNGYALISIDLGLLDVDNIKFTPQIIHGEDTVLSWDVIGYADNDRIRYRILVNGNEVVGWSDWYSIEPDTNNSFSETLSNSFFSTVGTYDVLLEVQLEESLDVFQFENSISKTNIISEITLTPSSYNIHDEVLKVDILITDPNINDEVRYKVYLNDNERNVWSWFDKAPFMKNISILNEELRIGTNKIKVDVEDNFGGFNTKEITVTKQNQNPIISVDYFEGNTLIFTVTDNDNDTVGFRVLINGTQQLPREEFGNYKQVPYQSRVMLDPRLINLGVENTITIEAKDDLGGIGTLPINKTFQLPIGLVFCDVNEQIYSDEVGLILRTLVHDDLVAGNNSEWIEVWVKNTYGNDMRNIKLIVNQGDLDPEHEIVEIAYPTIDYTSNREIRIGELHPNEKKSFFIRVNADREALMGGHFYVHCTGDPK
jgi:Glycine rich protein